MDTIYVITQPSTITDLPNIIAIVSTIGTFIALVFAYKAYRRFEYQTVKPLQIDSVLKFLISMNNYTIPIFLFNGDGIKKAILCFNNCEIESTEINEKNNKYLVITNEYLNHPIFLKGSEIRKYFKDSIDNIYMPKPLSNLLKQMIFCSSIINKNEIDSDFVVICDDISYNISTINEYNHIDKITTTNDYFNLIKNTIEATEEWLYKQGITNLDFNYFKPHYFNRVWKKLFN